MLRTTFSKGAADGSRLFNPFDLTFKNVANTGVIHWGGKLFALWEVRLCRCDVCMGIDGTYTDPVPELFFIF